MSFISSTHRAPTLYPSSKESLRALNLGIEILKNDDIKKDIEGFCLIDDLCLAIKEKDSTFRYINRNHIIEFFFKDSDRKILISGSDLIKYKKVIYVQPPDILYFGTIEDFIPKMKLNGIRSNTKGYLKLYATPEKACEFAEKFARVGEKTISLKINAKQAFSDGLKFSTFLKDEFIVVQLYPGYIL